MQWTSREPAGRVTAAGNQTQLDSDGRSDGGVCASLDSSDERLDRDNLLGSVTRLLRMERGEERGSGTVGPGKRRRLAAGWAEPDGDPRCTFGCRQRHIAGTSDSNGTIEIATIRHSPL